MKRFNTLVVMLALCAVLLAGCQKKESAASVDPNAPVTLTVWCWDPNFNIYAMNEAAKIYKQSKPNVSVNIVETPWEDLQQKLITAFSSGETRSLPDIILMQDNAIQKNVVTYPDAFAPINSKIDVSKFAQFKLDVGSYNGQNYGVPFDNGATATFLRSDIVEKAGLKVSDFNDITWERFIELGKIVKQKTGVAMISTDATGPDFIMVMLQSAGTWLFDAQGRTYIKNNPVLKRSIELFMEGVKEGVILMGSDWNAYVSTINNGTVASTVQGCWIIGSITGEPSQSGKWAMVNTPKLGTLPSVNYSSQGGSGWMVIASSKNKDTALDFLANTFAGSVELYETILPTSGAISTWLPAADSPVYAQSSAFFGGQQIYEELVKYAGEVPKVKYGVYNYEARTAITRGFMDVLAGKATIDQALEAAQKEVDFLVNQ